MIFLKPCISPSVLSSSKRVRSSRILRRETSTRPPTLTSAATSRRSTVLCLSLRAPHRHHHLRRDDCLAKMPLRVLGGMNQQTAHGYRQHLSPNGSLTVVLLRLQSP